MMKHLYALLLLFVLCATGKGQNDSTRSFGPQGISSGKSQNNDSARSFGPTSPQGISRNIIQDRKGNLWIAAFDGIFRYDGKSFTQITGQVTSSRFFSVLEDRKGNFWFGSLGTGVYCFDGRSFRNFTTRNGLASNEITCIYEDKAGHIWFGGNGGASRYDGKTFQNFILKADTLIEDKTGKYFLNDTPGVRRGGIVHEVNAIVEDKTGKCWFATRGKTFVYDGKTFTIATDGVTSFTNMRTVIEDKKGNIWLGGQDGLWRYDGSTFTNLKPDFTGYIYEDKKGNIWTSSQYTSTSPGSGNWALSRYDEKSLAGKKPAATEIYSKYEGNRGMTFGIVEAADGRVWFGALDGVHCYDGKTVTGFKTYPDSKK